MVATALTLLPRRKRPWRGPLFTNETIFALNEKPEHLIIIGGGPIGIEMAQAYRRLGCQVTVLAFTTWDTMILIWSGG